MTSQPTFVAALTISAIFVTSMAGAQGRLFMNMPQAHFSRNGVYHGKIRTDSVIYCHQLSFVNRDTALFFLNESASALCDIACATYYRVARLSPYYQLEGAVTDYYLDNDTVAARLTYKLGVLDGPCTLYYKNGRIREKGVYTGNSRTGIWEYYYENGQKAKTIRMTDDGPYLIDCYTETGELLTRNGNGRFEGMVVAGTSTRPIESKMSGPIENGVPDGEWQIYSTLKHQSSHPMMVEHFGSGKFLGGTSFSKYVTEEYNDKSFSSVESAHTMEALDHYGYNDWCTIAGRYANGAAWARKPYPQIDSAVRAILSSGRYINYTGWVLLDMHYDKKGRLSAKSVRLYDKNDAFQADLLAMIDRLPLQEPFTLNDRSTPYERFYVLLVQDNDVVIPEEVIDKQRRAAILGQ